MALEPVTNEIIAQICQVLGIESMNRPHAALIDPGDFGTVFTYIPLFPSEFAKLPLNLQRHVYVVAKGRYALVAFVPKNFEFAGDGEIGSITEVYDEYGNLREMSYSLTDREGVLRIENSLRRDKLLAFAKKKKILAKKIIRSKS